MPELSIGASFVIIDQGEVGFRSLEKFPGVRALPIFGGKGVEVGPRHPWVQNNDLGKFQLDRVMCDDAQAVFAPRVSIGHGDGRSILRKHASCSGIGR